MNPNCDGVDAPDKLGHDSANSKRGGPMGRLFSFQDQELRGYSAGSLFLRLPPCSFFSLAFSAAGGGA